MTNFVRIALLLLAAANLAFSRQVLVLNSGTRIEASYDGGNADTSRLSTNMAIATD